MTRRQKISELLYYGAVNVGSKIFAERSIDIDSVSLESHR